MPSNPSKSSVRQQIDENLKRVYDEALQEDIPDRFKQLLAQLKQKEHETAAQPEPGK
ncbi:MAG: transcriptional regulator [Rhodobacteraceae bacterium GWE1_64_9]|nr:MAG: transcriptional regulator [Rhodobacteraceae bacterium GWE1_64_9]OHC50449.1 MAG: transcriptional regulator [Rhodobacteraceae bacterium GWF1_65_7]HBD91730.1 transcriptional regulator [Gemmobacter sp.]HBU16423.1 transcriptional regulator [Gemmobacter sp.]